MDGVPDDFSSMDGFKKVASFSASVAAAVMYGFLYSVRSVNPSLDVRPGVAAGVAFFAGALVTWLYCRAVFADSDEAGDADRAFTRRKIQWTLGYLVFSVAGMLGAVILALRNVSSGRLLNVLLGAFMAVSVMSVGGFMIYRAIRFFEEDSDRALREEEEADEEE